jgi:hypothetical protein
MTIRSNLLLICLLSGIFCAPAAGQAPEVQPTSPSPPPLPPPSPETIDRLIRDLSSPRWTVREAACNALMDAGTAAYRSLRSEFRETKSYEVRKRIRQVAREIYMSEQLGPPRAFLGIAHGGINTPDSDDSRVPAWASGLFLREVFHGTGADRAGLLRGDLIMALNGRTGTKDFPALEFTQWIASQRPGTVCVLNVIRGGTGVRLDSSVIGGFTPAAFARARVKAVRHDDDPRVPYEAAGLLLEDDSVLDWKLKKEDQPHIAKGDLILALNEKPIPLEGAVEHFGRWCREELSVPAPPDNDARANPAPPKPSVQLLRGGKGFDLDVTLGRRPAHLDQAARLPRGAEPTQREQALASFAAWWQETFDPQGLLADTAEEDPRWELEPRWGGR